MQAVCTGWGVDRHTGTVRGANSITAANADVPIYLNWPSINWYLCLSALVDIPRTGARFLVGGAEVSTSLLNIGDPPSSG